MYLVIRSSCKTDLLVWSVSIRNSFYIQDHCYTCQHPFCWRMLCLELSTEHEGGTSRRGHVHWALIDSLIFFTVCWKWS